MPRSKRDVTKCLLKKGFTEESDRDHRYFYVYDSEGKKTIVNTKISHSSKKDLHDGLLGEMRRQMRLDRKLFEEYMNCHLKKRRIFRNLSAKRLIPLNGIIFIKRLDEPIFN